MQFFELATLGSSRFVFRGVHLTGRAILNLSRLLWLGSLAVVLKIGPSLISLRWRPFSFAILWTVVIRFGRASFEAVDYFDSATVVSVAVVCRQLSTAGAPLFVRHTKTSWTLRVS